MLGMNGPIQGVIMIFLYRGYLSPTHVIAFLVHSPGSISGIHSIQHTSNQPEAIQTIWNTCTIEQYTLQIQVAIADTQNTITYCYSTFYSRHYVSSNTGQVISICIVVSCQFMLYTCTGASQLLACPICTLIKIAFE